MLKSKKNIALGLLMALFCKISLIIAQDEAVELPEVTGEELLAAYNELKKDKDLVKIVNEAQEINEVAEEAAAEALEEEAEEEAEDAEEEAEEAEEEEEDANIDDQEAEDMEEEAEEK